MEALQQGEEKGNMVKLPIPHQKAHFNEIYIRGNRPLPVYIKHAHKVLIKHNCIIIHAMTAAIDKAVRLHVYLMEEYPYLNAQIVTNSVPSITNCNGNFELKERSAIHITLTKS